MKNNFTKLPIRYRCLVSVQRLTGVRVIVALGM